MAGFLDRLLGKAVQGSEDASTRRELQPDPFARDLGPGDPGDPVRHQVAATLLGYPTPELLALLLELTDLARALPDPRLEEAVAAVGAWLTRADLATVQGDYVQEFDLSRRHALSLSYWTDGDTRRRGEALGRFKRLYRDSGMLTDLHGELPDHLPIVLEFAAQVDPAAGRAALQAYRPSLELLRFALRDAQLPHELLIDVVCRTLPGELAPSREAVHAMAAAAPPTETVGLGFDDPRLLPVYEKTPTGERP